MSVDRGLAEARTTALMAGVSPGDGDAEHAELLIRRLANRHGHTRDTCPDREAHVRDVAAMAVALEAAGFVPYEPGNGRKPPRGCAQTIVNYERPGRSS